MQGALPSTTAARNASPPPAAAITPFVVAAAERLDHLGQRADVVVGRGLLDQRDRKRRHRGERRRGDAHDGRARSATASLRAGGGSAIIAVIAAADPSSSAPAAASPMLTARAERASRTRVPHRRGVGDGQQLRRARGAAGRRHGGGAASARLSADVATIGSGRVDRGRLGRLRRRLVRAHAR